MKAADWNDKLLRSTVQKHRRKVVIADTVDPAHSGISLPIAGRGRPVVRPYQPLWATFASTYSALELIVNLTSSPHQRRRALKMLSRWPHCVEAVYRGEHALAKAKQVRGPSDYAEDAVADALAISAACIASAAASADCEKSLVKPQTFVR